MIADACFRLILRCQQRETMLTAKVIPLRPCAICGEPYAPQQARQQRCLRCVDEEERRKDD